MGKKTFFFILMALLVAGVVKMLFFSGITQGAATPVFKQAREPGYVWASAGPQYSRSRVGAFLLGQHYRSVWTTPIKAPVVDIDRLKGGLQIGKMGGGQQTTSLSLVAPSGQTWVLRSLDKDPVNILPPFWRRTILANLLRDQIAAAHPYGALVVSELAEAAGIFHTNPQVFFVPARNPRFRQHRARMGNRLFLLEEKYTDSAQAWPQFKGASRLLDSREMLDNRFRKQAHRIDALAFARCRLFDLFIGDWDRHEGQWSWAAYPKDSMVYYKPVPKDRDQAFSRYQDGLLPWLLTRNFAMRKFGQFNDLMPDVADYSVNAAFIDERILNAVTLPEYKALARLLQAQITDSVIAAAVKKLPPPVYRLSGSTLSQQLKSRRQYLEQIAASYYRILAHRVVVPGTDQREYFKINRLPDGRVLVRVFSLLPDGTAGHMLYRRLFNETETDEITLHGLGGNDKFEVTGKADRSIKINIVGGLGEDIIADYSEVMAGGKSTFVFDTRQGNEITWGPGTADKTTDDLAVHQFDREGL